MCGACSLPYRPQSMKRNKKKPSGYALYNVPDAVRKPDETEEKNKPASFSPLRIILLILSAALFIFSAFMLIKWMVQNKQAEKASEAAREIYSSTTNAPSAAPVSTTPPSPVPEATATVIASLPEPENVPDPVYSTPAPSVTFRPWYQDVGSPLLERMDALTGVNRDTAGWLKIAGLVDEPVVYRDNEYYLDHLFDGSKNPAGTLFLDEDSPVKAKTQYLLIHGHNMKDGSRFAPITHFVSKGNSGLSFLKDHPFATFSTLREENEYVIWAVCKVCLDYTDPAYVQYWAFSSFSSEYEFNSFIRNVRRHSLYSIPVDINPSDTLLTLSTCIGEDRVAVFYRKLRSNEWEDSMKKLVHSSELN